MKFLEKAGFELVELDENEKKTILWPNDKVLQEHGYIAAYVLKKAKTV